MIGCLQSIWSCILTDISIDAPCIQINARAKYRSLTKIRSSRDSLYPFQNSLFHNQFRYLCLLYRQMLRILQNPPHRTTIFTFICLRSQGMNRRSFGPIQHLGLNKCFVNIFPHLTAKRIDLSHKMSLRTSSDIWITGHQCNRIHTYREDDCLQP